MRAEYAKFGLSLDIGSTGVESSLPAPVTDVSPAGTGSVTMLGAAPVLPPPPVTGSAGRRLKAATKRASAACLLQRWHALPVPDVAACDRLPGRNRHDSGTLGLKDS